MPTTLHWTLHWDLGSPLSRLLDLSLTTTPSEHMHSEEQEAAQKRGQESCAQDTHGPSYPRVLLRHLPHPEKRQKNSG